MSKWISVKERLPEVWQYVLLYITTDEESRMDIGVLDRENSGIWRRNTYEPVDSLYGGEEVTHWMPLPAPPEATP